MHCECWSFHVDYDLDQSSFVHRQLFIITENNGGLEWVKFSLLTLLLCTLAPFENKPPPLFDLKFLHRYFYLINRPPPVRDKSCA